MDVAAAHTEPGEVFGEFFCHAFGQGGHQNAFVDLAAFTDLFEQVVHLILRRADLDPGIEQTRGSDELFCNNALRSLQFIFCRRGPRRSLGFEAVRIPRTAAADCPKQLADGSRSPPDSPFGWSSVHGPDLRDSDMAFIDDHQIIIYNPKDRRDAAQPAGRPGSGCSFQYPSNNPTLDHLQIEIRSLFESLGFQQTGLAGKEAWSIRSS